MPTPRTVVYQYSPDADSIAAILADADFLRRHAETSGETNIDIQVEESADRRRVQMSRDVEVQLPGFAKRLFQPRNRVAHEQVWNRQGQFWVSEFVVKIGGVPSEIRGRAKIEPAGAGCTYEAVFEVTSRVPVVGGWLEGFVADAIEVSLRTEVEYAAQVLATG